MAVCRDCAREYEVWPDGGCPNCGSAEPAGDGDPAVAAPPESAETKAATRTRPGRRGSTAPRQATSGDG